MMKAVTVSFKHPDLGLLTGLKRLALVCAATTGLALLAAPVWAQSTSPQPSSTQPSSGSAQTSQSSSTQPSGSTSQTTQSSKAAQPGVRAVDAASVRLTFYTVRPADMLALNLMGLDVHNLKNEEIGEIEDLIVDEGKTIRGIVLGIGGFLGMGERHTSVDPGAIVITREAGGGLKAVVNTTKEELQKAPEFKFEGNMARRK